jgi:phosphoribosyl 1,2-cyclic phosphate phosphodiesterase
MPPPNPPRSIDLAGQLLFLGTGTSTGVPMIGCNCTTCTSDNPKNKRTRCSVVLGLPEGNLLIDTTPDLRSQMLREGVGMVQSLLFTHDHADHILGLDDVRSFNYFLGGPLPTYCEDFVEARLRRSFDYAFDPDAPHHGGGVPQLQFHRITTEPFAVLGQRIIPIRLGHGRFRVLGFRIDNVAYCTDTNLIPEPSLPLLEGLDVLVLDALRLRPHSTHFGLEQAIAAARRLRPKRTLFTHMSHELEHETTNATLPAGMELAYDGLRLPLR